MKSSKTTKATAHCVRDQKIHNNQVKTVKSWRSNRGYMFAMMLAMLALMAAMGVGLSRLLMTTKATTQMQRVQDNKQLLNSVIMTLSTKAVDGDSDNVLEPPPMDSVVRSGTSSNAAPGLVPTDVAHTDAWGRRLGYCGYDWGSQTLPLGPTDPRGLIHSYTPLGEQSSPPDSAVAIIVVSAGPDGVFNMPDGTVMTPSDRPFCIHPIDSSVTPNTLTASSKVVAGGDDMVAARSYGEMLSLGNAQIASTLSGLGTNTSNKLCRLGSDGKMVCDIPTGLNDSNTANRLCRTDSTGAVVCDAETVNCGSGGLSKWYNGKLECINTRTTGCYWKDVPDQSYQWQCDDAGIEYVAGIGYEGGTVGGIRRGAWSSDTDNHIRPEVDKILCCKIPAN